jgi:hypothetical protein
MKVKTFLFIFIFTLIAETISAAPIITQSKVYVIRKSRRPYVKRPARHYLRNRALIPHSHPKGVIIKKPIKRRAHRLR